LEKEKYLINDLKRGSKKAFIELYEMYWEKLYYVCYKRTGSQIETEDIIQDLFLDLWKNREKMEIHTSLAAYIFTALKYKIFRMIESKKVRGKYVQRIDGYEPAAEETIESNIAFKELYYLFEQNVEKLPKKCRLVFKMSRNEELTAEEISRKLNISKSTVHNQITKANKIIKNEIKKLFILFLF
jgi:RNA polymerase sigma-19 factor, ECF subfamily